jgi:hypothetical protein
MAAHDKHDCGHQQQQRLPVDVQGPRSRIGRMSAEVVDDNPYSRLMALQRMGIVKDYERIRQKTVQTLTCLWQHLAIDVHMTTWLPAWSLPAVYISSKCDCAGGNRWHWRRRQRGGRDAHTLRHRAPAHVWCAQLAAVAGVNAPCRHLHMRHSHS